MTNQSNNGILGWLGTCHVCKEAKLIKFCPVCNHWFCDECRYSKERVESALKEWVSGRQENCCGPLENK